MIVYILASSGLASVKIKIKAAKLVSQVHWKSITRNWDKSLPDAFLFLRLEYNAGYLGLHNYLIPCSKKKYDRSHQNKGKPTEQLGLSVNCKIWCKV